MLDVRLLPTSYVVLGLVTLRPRVGHELAGYAERSIGNFFSLTRSHVYSQLDRLCELGLLAATEVPQKRLPTKRVYRLADGPPAAFRRATAMFGVLFQQGHLHTRSSDGGLMTLCEGPTGGLANRAHRPPATADIRRAIGKDKGDNVVVRWKERI